MTQRVVPQRVERMLMDRPPVQYATTPSGARVAFAVGGEGQAVVLPPLTAWTLYPPRPIPPATDLWQLATDVRLLAFNHAGTGLSQRAGYDFSLDATVGELRAVVEAADFRDFVLLAGGCAGPPAIKYAVEHPDRVGHLILRETWAASERAARMRLMMFGAAIKGDWEAASQGYARLGWNLNREEADAVAAGIRSAIETDTLLEYFECVAEHDVRALLRDVSVPTTVMRRPESPSPLEAEANHHTDELVQAIPGAKLRLFEGSSTDWSTYSSFLEERG